MTIPCYPHVCASPATLCSESIENAIVIVHADGCDHVSELRPLAGLLSIPQMMCEYGEPG
jgi:hypothetical protein